MVKGEFFGYFAAKSILDNEYTFIGFWWPRIRT